ncbi:MAG: hypothetical protein ACRD5D_03710 [Candidatus Polarisedimenticolia bacterium]
MRRTVRDLLRSPRRPAPAPARFPAGLLALAALALVSLACGGPGSDGTPDAGEPVCAGIEALPPHAREQVAALARLLAIQPAMAIDFTHASGETCLNTGTQVMAHFTTRPEESKEDIVYFVDVAPLVDKGLRIEEFPVLDPALGGMAPNTWYRYEGKGVEPHHGREMADRRWLMLAVDVR